VRAFARKLLQSYESRRGDIDLLVAESCDNWDFEDVGKVERAVLRMAATELLCQPDVPVPVAIDEAVELTKIYAADGSGSFVNGVLSKVSQSARTGGTVTDDG
jgi:N utilization substance protein B